MTARASKPVKLPPTPDEIIMAIANHKAAIAARRKAEVEYMDARRVLVDALKRAGVEGFSL